MPEHLALWSVVKHTMSKSQKMMERCNKVTLQSLAGTKPNLMRLRWNPYLIFQTIHLYRNVDISGQHSPTCLRLTSLLSGLDNVHSNYITASQISDPSDADCYILSR